MDGNIDFHIPDQEEFLKGCDAYKKEKRGFVYFEAKKTIQNNWGNSFRMAEGVQRLIRSWNRFFANFDFDELVNCIERNLQILNGFRERHIESLTDADSDIIKNIFNQFLAALKRTKDNVKSPVSVAKALSPIAPDFFPLWDSAIAYKYGFLYVIDAASDYLLFCHKMKLFAEQVNNYISNLDDRSLLKRIDEYNYSKYTTHWI